MSTKPIKKILTGRLLPLLRAEEYDAALRVYCLTIYGEVYCGLAGKGRYDASVGRARIPKVLQRSAESATQGTPRSAPADRNFGAYATKFGRV
jgi:hypothetical protein